MTRTNPSRPSSNQPVVVQSQSRHAEPNGAGNSQQEPRQILTALFRQLGHHRTKLFQLQAERIHAMREYLRGRQFFESSVVKICCDVETEARVDSDTIAVTKMQLLQDGRALSAKSELVVDLEKKVTSTEWSISRLESEIAGALLAFVPSCPAALGWARDMGFPIEAIHNFREDDEIPVPQC
ncbi:hypothetical protein AC578_7511 [Pseudocercospora eumusae]|uniref:Uncharacterized protein n=1 Tax=Pseudocercospora eumusae TaxID=321146 RepID=A0A139GWI0_9PEZI|nr:hypothetical protein AC578_7511 [Pseudocercospora eumusae]